LNKVISGLKIATIEEVNERLKGKTAGKLGIQCALDDMRNEI